MNFETAEKIRTEIEYFKNLKEEVALMHDERIDEIIAKLLVQYNAFLTPQIYAGSIKSSVINGVTI